ncbi:Mitochondrial distribution and morphology protein 34 [Ceratocystis lukuohia]|uniref:Mitochondrial distribution and morphology protein 34 n=1 Tax=Ceratocystis lukuohia TaxID=2019550 RepID=A0ABR4MJ43_9PEZI
MAFNFNWSPLTADADFYNRATDLLTTALNKSPKPPIIVDDIFVTELNLGSVPPDLEILEIGDIAEDRFRGIFKMTYSGDAFLTLRTRVQANPLNTYLSSKPSFTSPKPLAAASGLTIPLSITLSEIKLSAFIILVFSRQKGLTLVFRNDPLESLKVSSTFDSIQFVRDYLQRTIEGQLRTLMMDELPAIIHRLSLRLWCKDQLPKEDIVGCSTSQSTASPATSDPTTANFESDPLVEEPAINPLATPPLDPVDSNGNVVDPHEISAFSINDGQPVQSLFSHHSLMCLATLTDSPRTLSLFTPGINDTLYRACHGLRDRPDGTATAATATPSLSKQNSYTGNLTSFAAQSSSVSTTYSFSDSSSTTQGYAPSRSSGGLHSPTTGLALGSGRTSRTYQSRKKRNRVVNLRKTPYPDADVSSADGSSSIPDSASSTDKDIPISMSEPMMTSSIAEEPSDPIELDRLMAAVPSASASLLGPSASLSPISTAAATTSPSANASGTSTPSAKVRFDALQSSLADSPTSPNGSKKPTAAPVNPTAFSSLAAALKESERLKAHGGAAIMSTSSPPETSSVILEQAWISKMAGEIARRVYEEKSRRDGFWDDRERASNGEDAPPAYTAR